jgi:hypothetical protein
MIEHQIINKRPAAVAYFNHDFEPVSDLSQPHFAKVLFDDGECLILHSDGYIRKETK